MVALLLRPTPNFKHFSHPQCRNARLKFAVLSWHTTRVWKFAALDSITALNVTLCLMLGLVHFTHSSDQVFTVKWILTVVSICLLCGGNWVFSLKLNSPHLYQSVQGSRSNKFHTLMWNTTFRIEWKIELGLYCKFYWCLYFASCLCIICM